MKQYPPRRTGAAPTEISITGYFSPFYANNQPVLFDLKADKHFLFVFSTPEKLKAEMRRTKTKFDKIVQITDGSEFLASIAGRVRVALDIHDVGGGKYRFHELFAEVFPPKTTVVVH